MTCGASPQALRLQTQARKRAKASQKQEESTRNEQQAQTEQNTTASATVDDISIIRHTSIVQINTGTETKSLSSSGKSKSMSDLSGIDEANGKNQSKNDERSSQPMQQSKCPSFEEECNEHMQPTVVDTSEVLGNITQVSLY